ncbi:MAG: hypothetical protein KQJ78_14685 [Deltaproteobacteria bacterium]|nr:hypothetical protein [Deltaproteobacteria bacterium]
MNSARLPVLILPSPWGVGLMLGLIDSRPHAHECPPGDYRVYQTGADGDIAAALARLVAVARERRRPHPCRQAPWPAFLPGEVGLVEVLDCRREEDLFTFQLVLANPRPAWVEGKGRAAA